MPHVAGPRAPAGDAIALNASPTMPRHQGKACRQGPPAARASLLADAARTPRLSSKDLDRLRAALREAQAVTLSQGVAVRRVTMARQPRHGAAPRRTDP
jgi:hypothetical protein